MSSSSAAKTRTALTLAAGAAAALTAQQQAGAAVVYTPLNAQVNAANPFVNIDFNHDGMPAVSVAYRATTAPPFSTTIGLALTKQQSMSFPGYVAGTGPSAVKALSAGDTIDGTLAFNDLFTYSGTPFPLDGAINDGAGNGEFTAAAGERYLGVEFGFGPTGGPYFGWIGFRVDDDSSLGNLSGTVTGYAFENTLGQPIAAGAIPEPSSLGLLAMGATGLAAYRRRGR